MANLPLLSVVIPTHNRARYARYAIESILSIASPLLPLVVHDTSVSDERLKHIRYRDRLSLTENHNAAMQAADGEYVCMIGDDDTIMPEALEAIQWARDNAIDALTPTVVANYAWPDFRSRFFGRAHAGRLYIKPNFRKAHVADAKVALPRFALAGKVIQVMAETAWRLGRRLMIPTAAGGRYYIPKLTTIADAQTALLDYLKTKRHRFGDFV